MIDIFVVQNMIHIEVRTDLAKFETHLPCTLENLELIQKSLSDELIFVQRYIREFMPIETTAITKGTLNDK